jgi:RND family efflux transporter MFP subunit
MDPEGSSNLRARIVVSIVVVLLFLALGAALFIVALKLRKAPPTAPGTAPRTVVRVVTAHRAPFREVLEGYGRARALRQGAVAAEVGGVVRALSPDLEAGALVTRGDELVWIDARDYERALESALARQSQAESTVTRLQIDLENIAQRLVLTKEDFDTSKRELERVKGLTEEGVVTRSELDRQRISTSLTEKQLLTLQSQESTTRQELSRAVEEVKSAVAARTRAQLDLSRAVVTAPYSGRILERNAQLGATVGPGATLFTLVDLSRVEVPVALGASHFGEVAVGAPAAIRLREGEDVVWRGKVARVAPTVRAEDSTFLVYLEVEGAVTGNPVPPGAFIVAEIEGKLHPEVFAIPRAAFISERVYVARPKLPAGKGEGVAVIAERTPIIDRLLPETALVKDGLAEGDLVVVTNLEQIADGSTVQLVDESGEGVR